MNSSIPPFFHLILPEDISGISGLLAILGLYVLLSWLVCVTAAFFKVREVHFGVGYFAMGASLLMAFLLMGLCKSLFPDLAASFTPSGLFMVSAVSGAFVCSVPLVQYYWNLSYRRGLMIICSAVGALIMTLVMLHMFFYPAESLPARFAAPLFQDHQPGLSD